MSRKRVGLVRESAVAICVTLLFSAPGFANDIALGGESYAYDAVGCSTCDVGCSGCGNCCSGCGNCCKLFGIIAPTAPCFDGFISPMTNPFFFEDPRTLSEMRIIFAHHDIPRGTLAGGDVQLMAVQVRAALTDRLSILATKDGFIFGQPNGHPDGWIDVAMGLKYLLCCDPVSQSLLSAGFTYEIPVGSTRALQGGDDGDFHIFASSGKQLGSYMNWISGTGFRLAVDEQRGSDLWYWSNHFDVQLTDCLYPFVEFNWFNWTRSGGGPIAGIEGNDLYNLGSTGVAGNNIVTMGAGLKHKPRDNVELGVVYEFPLTQRRDLLESRLTVDCILRY